jgi:hypothetical protein
VKAAPANISKNVPVSEKSIKNDDQAKTQMEQVSKANTAKTTTSNSALNMQKGDGEVMKTAYDYATYWNSRLGRAGMDALEAVGALPALASISPPQEDLSYHNMMMDHQRMVDRMDELCKETDANIATMKVFLLKTHSEHL